MSVAERTPLGPLMRWHGTEPGRCEEPCSGPLHVRRCTAAADHAGQWHDCAPDWMQRRAEACAERGHSWAIDDTQDYVYCVICLSPKAEEA